MRGKYQCGQSGMGVKDCICWNWGGNGRNQLNSGGMETEFSEILLAGDGPLIVSVRRRCEDGGGDQNLEGERGGGFERHDICVWLNRSLGFTCDKSKEPVCWGGGGVSGLEFVLGFVRSPSWGLKRPQFTFLCWIHLIHVLSPFHFHLFSWSPMAKRACKILGFGWVEGEGFRD